MADYKQRDDLMTFVREWDPKDLDPTRRYPIKGTVMNCRPKIGTRGVLSQSCSSVV
jgi:hypothetical protein